MSQDLQSIQFKFAATSAGEVEGYGSIFGNVDAGGDRVVRGAFLKSLATRGMPLMLWQHKRDEPIGRWTDAGEDDVGLYLVGKVNLETTHGRDAHAHVKAGDVNGLSIGYGAVKARQNGLVRDLIELDLPEVSIVSFPMNNRTRITGVKAESRADLERILREGGLPRAAAVKAAIGGWPLLSGEQLDPEIIRLSERLDSATAELKSLKGLFR